MYTCSQPTKALVCPHPPAPSSYSHSSSIHPYPPLPLVHRPRAWLYRISLLSIYQALSLLDLYLAFLSHGNEIAYAVQSETLIPLCMSHFSKYTPTLLHFNPSQLLHMSAA